MDLVPALLYVLLRAVNALALADAHAPAPAPAVLDAPCDPGFGDPRPTQTCPGGRPVLGRVMSYEGGEVTVQPVRVWWTGPAGEAYAEAHGLDYPFANDYYQRDVGEQVRARVLPGTVCTGSIAVGYTEPLHDHRVDCAAFANALQRHGSVTSALWFQSGRLVQLSELYRP